MWKIITRIMTLNPFLTKTRTTVSPISIMGKAGDLHTKGPKPPNILLFGPGQDHKLTSAVLRCLETCLAADRYIIYSINLNSFKKDPWIENTEMLIVWCSKQFLIDSSFQNQVSTRVNEYLAVGGKVLNFCSFHQNEVKFTSKNIEIPDQIQVNTSSKLALSLIGWSGKFISFPLSAGTKSITSFNYEGKDWVVAVLKEKNLTSSLSLLNQLGGNDEKRSSSLQLLKLFLNLLNVDCMEDANKPNLSEQPLLPCNTGVLFISSLDKKQKFLSWFSRKDDSDDYFVKGLKLVTQASSLTNTDKNGDNVVAVYSTSEQPIPLTIQHQFDFECYRQHLKCKTYGHIAVYADIIGTTMNVFDGLTMRFCGPLGLVAIARQQTKGQGRSGNKWLSPVGCAMFTLTISIPINSKLGRALPILQHMTAVAVAQAITSMPGLQNVNIGVKWPNDIYFGKHVKLGGVVVKSTVIREFCIASIGCGVNIANKKPTVCVNQILKEQYGLSETIKCEHIIAGTLTQLESIVEDFQQHGSKKFLEAYYKYWIHSGSYVKVQSQRDSEEKFNALVVGIDDYGYLRVRLDDGSVTSLSPDGNSFDLTQNLIISKT